MHGLKTHTLSRILCFKYILVFRIINPAFGPYSLVTVHYEYAIFKEVLGFKIDNILHRFTLNFIISRQDFIYM